MNPLWTSIGIVTTIVVAALLMALLRRPGAAGAARRDYDLAVYKDQLAELANDLERGQIGEAEAKAARAEIERRILGLAEAEPAPQGKARGRGAAGWLSAAAIGLGIPALSFGLYLHLGTPDYPNVPHAGRDLAAEQDTRQRREQAGDMAELAAKLAARLEAEPGNVKGWLLLGRTYLTLERESDAVAALRKAAALAPEDPDVAVELAEVLVFADKHRVGQEARELFRRALSADARRPRPRYYLALGLAQDGKLKEALQGWVDLLAVSPPDAPWRATVDASISRAAQDLKIDPADIKPTLAAKLLGPGKPAAAAPAAPAPSAPPAASSPGPTREDMEAAQGMSADDRMAMIRSMVERLAERLKREPDDLAGWQRLARAYRVLGEADKAGDAESQIKRLSQ